MIFEIFNDIVAYLDIKEINHDKLKHIFGHIKYPINVKFDNERSSYNNATKNITIQAQGKSDFLHETTHKSVTEKFTHFYPYYPHNNTQHINFLIASKEVLCNFSKVVQESCLDICNIKNATIEELYSNMQQIHSSLRKHVSDKICLLAIGEYGNELFDTSHYFYKKLYAIVFVTMIDLLTHKTEECKTLDGCPENISLNILFNGFTILEKMILHEKNFEAFGKFAIEASLQYDPSFDNTNKNAATKSPVLTKGREMSSITFPLVLKTLPKLSIASEKFGELWQTHLDKTVDQHSKLKSFSKKFSANVLNHHCNITAEKNISKAIAYNTQESSCSFTPKFIGSLTDLLDRDVDLMLLEIFPRAIQTIMKEDSDRGITLYDESYDSNCELMIFSPVIDYYTSLN